MTWSGPSLLCHCLLPSPSLLCPSDIAPYSSSATSSRTVVRRKVWMLEPVCLGQDPALLFTGCFSLGRSVNLGFSHFKNGIMKISISYKTVKEIDEFIFLKLFQSSSSSTQNVLSAIYVRLLSLLLFRALECLAPFAWKTHASAHYSGLNYMSLCQRVLP